VAANRTKVYTHLHATSTCTHIQTYTRTHLRSNMSDGSGALEGSPSTCSCRSCTNCNSARAREACWVCCCCCCCCCGGCCDGTKASRAVASSLQGRLTSAQHSKETRSQGFRAAGYNECSVLSYHILLVIMNFLYFLIIFWWF